MIDYSKVIPVLRPGAPFLVNGDEYNGIKMLDGSEPPTKTECDAAWKSVVIQMANDKIRQQIADIEARSGRAIREAALGDKTHLVKINANIESLRATLK